MPAIKPILVLLCQEKVAACLGHLVGNLSYMYDSFSRDTIFDMVDFEFLDKVMQMVTTPGNHTRSIIYTC